MLIDNEPITCPYCNIVTTRRHSGHCPDEPKLHARLAAALADPEHPGSAISKYAYAKIARPLGLPAEITLKKHYGTWFAAMAAFGLKPANIRRQETNKAKRRSDPPQRRQNKYVDCPHCQLLFRTSNIARHLRRCLHQPGMFERLRSIIESPPGSGLGIGLMEYRRRADAWRAEQPEETEPLPATQTMQTYFPEWDDLLHWLGLISEDEAIDAKTAADNARYKAMCQAERALELESWGLPVSSVQKPNPIVRPDEVFKNCVRTMIR